MASFSSLCIVKGPDAKHPTYTALLFGNGICQSVAFTTLSYKYELELNATLQFCNVKLHGSNHCLDISIGDYNWVCKVVRTTDNLLIQTGVRGYHQHMIFSQLRAMIPQKERVAQAALQTMTLTTCLISPMTKENKERLLEVARMLVKNIRSIEVEDEESLGASRREN
jgi:hypothetical protein